MSDSESAVPPQAVVEVALQALDHQGPGLLELARHYAGAASARLYVGVDFEFTTSWAGTVVGQASDAMAHFGLSDAAQRLAIGLWGTDGPANLRVANQVALQAPRVRLTRTVSMRWPELVKRLDALAVGRPARGAVERIMRKLTTDDVARVGIDVTRPDGEPRVVVEIDQAVSADDASQWAAQFTLASTVFGCSQRQQQWFRHAAPALLPRPANLVTTRFVLSPRGMTPALTADFYELPVRPALLLARQFSLLEGEAAARIGALTGAVGVPDERIDRLQITLRNMEPPEFAIELDRPDA